MRSLLAAPAAFIDPASGAPAFGSYIGALPPIDLGAGAAERLFKRKKWFYVGIAGGDVWLSMAVVRTGYATSAFAFVFDRATGRMLVDRAVIGPLRAAEIVDDAHAAGVIARFDAGKTSVTIERRGHAWEVGARFDGLELDARLDDSTSVISAIAPLASGPSATEKRALMKVRGQLVCGGRRLMLDGALGGYDYTQGLMPRRTRWRWAFGMGRAKDGAPIGFNLVEGFVGEAECAAFRNGVFPLGEPRFEMGEHVWRLRGEGIDLVFDVGAVHAQRTNMLVVRSRFVQPAGHFRGTVRIGDRDVELDGVPGVVEDQDVVW
jgi:hypothetical protein